MKLSDLFERLSVGELSNLAIGKEGAGDIREADKRKVVTHVNSGLLEIYSRFILLTKIITVEMVSHITNYHLEVSNAESKDCAEYPYIKDLPNDPFTGDVIRILEVIRWDNKKIPLNDDNNPDSAYTPAPQMLQMPYPIHGKQIYITYQARHLPIKTHTGTENVRLPFVLEDALQSYVAYKIFSHMNGDGAVARSQEHLAMFERRCQEVEEKDLVNMSPNVTTLKLCDRGFV